MSKFRTRGIYQQSRHSRRRRAVTALSCAVAVGLLASACGGESAGGGDSNGKTVIRFANWADTEPNTQPGIQALIKSFEAAHPDIEIKSEPVSYTDIEHQLVLQVQSGNPPDVAELQGNYTLNIGETGAFQPLDGLADAQFQQSIIPSELELGKIDGKLQAIPWTVGPFALWYNKKILKDVGLDPAKPPTTWDELLTDLQKIHQSKPKVIALGVDSTNRTYGLDTNWSIMKSFGAQPFQGSTATADTPEMKAYLGFMQKIAKNGYTPPNQKGGYFRQPAASDQVAFTIDGPYVKGVVQSANHMTDQEFYDTWGVAPLPTATGQHYSAPTDHQLVMFKNSKHQKAAWEFMKFLATSPEGVQYAVKYEGSLPSVANPPAEVAKELDNPIAQAFRNDVIPTVNRPEWGSHYANTYSDIMAGIQGVMTGSGSIDSVASQMQSAVKTGLGG
ncbi:ABC transporter substrate-binding protein [Streptomyces sp. NPDC058424]|uniref:ABC transporter substrate-binding protein n=1 Tax=Streptomyces sp. NPDC058424 TaxID=3346491 RepID=UPI0036510D27